MQASGATAEQIENAIVDDTDAPPRKQTTAQQAPAPSGEPGVLDDAAIAQQRLAQAKTFMEEAERLTAEAYELDPSLKPKKRGRPKQKATA